jgi:protein CpxP
MKSIKNTFITGLTIMGLSMAGAAYAQQAPTKRGEGMDRAKMVEKMQEKRKESMEKHRTHFHDALKLTPAQEPAWKTFTEATKKPEQKAKQDRKAIEAMSAPARMEMMLNHSQERMAMMQKHLAAVKTFYAVLTPEQQKTFDKMSMRMQKQRKHMREKRQGMQKMQQMHQKMHGKEGASHAEHMKK